MGRRRLLRQGDVVDLLGVRRSRQRRDQELGAPGARPLLAGEAVQDRDPEVREPAGEAVGPERMQRSPETHGVEAAGGGGDVVARAGVVTAGKEDEGVVKSSHADGRLQAA